MDVVDFVWALIVTISVIFRENARNLADQNFSLRTQMEKNEEDTIDVITLLTKKDEEKEQQVNLPWKYCLNPKTV